MERQVAFPFLKNLNERDSGHFLFDNWDHVIVQEIPYSVSDHVCNQLLQAFVVGNWTLAPLHLSLQVYNFGV